MAVKDATVIPPSDVETDDADINRDDRRPYREVGHSGGVHRPTVAERLASMLPAPQRKRLNLILSEKHIERLERLQLLTDSSSVAEVIREAVFVYEKLVEKLMLGSSLKELTGDGDLYPLELGIDVHPPKLEVHENGPDGVILRSYPKRRAGSR